MKRVLKIMALCMAIVCFPISVSAAVAIEPMSTNLNTATLALTFSGNTANCTVTINGATGTTRIDNCTITLRESNGTLVAEWENLSATGGTLRFSRTASPVIRGKTYTLSFTATVHRNGVAENVSGAITRTYN